MIHFKFTAVGMKQMWDLTNIINLIALDENKTWSWIIKMTVFSSAAIEVVSEIDELCNIDIVIDYVYIYTGPKINTDQAPNVSKNRCWWVYGR